MPTRTSHGYLPAGRYVVNHDIMHCTAEGVAGNDLYSGRALGLTEPGDYIQLHPVLKPLWHDIIESLPARWSEPHRKRDLGPEPGTTGCT